MTDTMRIVHLLPMKALVSNFCVSNFCVCNFCVCNVTMLFLYDCCFQFKRKSIRITEDPMTHSICIVGAKAVIVESETELLECLGTGGLCRMTGEFLGHETLHRLGHQILSNS